MGNKWKFYSNMLKTYWQIPAGLILYIAATLCILHIPFPTDLATSEPQCPSVPQAMYYAMQIFVLEGIPLGTPNANGAEWYCVYPLWVLYFLAPFLTANFLFVFVKSLFLNPEKGISKYKGHIVVCGIGKVGNALVEKLYPSHHVVAVEKDPNCRYLLDYKKKKIPYVVGDMTVKATLDRTNISNASHIFCVSNDDMANMDAIMAVKRILKKENLGLKCFYQITDMNLYDNINEYYRSEAGEEVINGYKIAAEKIVESICPSPDGQEERQKLIVIAGFGSMGKRVTKELLRNGTKQSKFIIIDRREESNPINFIKYLVNDETFKGFKYDFRNCDINLPSTWDEVAVKAIKGKKDLIVILATDDDVRNVGTAMMIQNRVKRAQAAAPDSNKINLIIITRLFRNVSFLDTQKENVRSFVFYDTVIDEFKQMVEKTNP